MKPVLVNPTLASLIEATVKVSLVNKWGLGTRNVTINFAGTRGSLLSQKDAVHFKEVIRELLLVDQSV